MAYDKNKTVIISIVLGKHWLINQSLKLEDIKKRQICTLNNLLVLITGARLFGVSGCYPSCPAETPFFNEDTMKCVSWEQCGCYDDKGNHYDIGDETESENCYKWYVMKKKIVFNIKSLNTFMHHSLK